MPELRCKDDRATGKEWGGMTKYYGYTEEEIKSLSQNNQDLGRIQARMEQLKDELFMMKVRLQVDDMLQKGDFEIYE